ncbi:VOC family protein [Tsukamurella spumae]|uniref:VOC family protein n=1 Tax=Tsukamurella spumae TaxID=44753 RepID=A0A846X3G2_9ACTN|nr:VOC family protein [Tsukamurella spumae]NKY18410.1 VOC family protein [Tsukamurella spumae]
MALTLQMINLDCADVAGQAAFWSQALGVPVDENDGNAFMRTVGYQSPALPRMMFLKVPEGKTVKNRMHLDLHADDRAAEVARLVALGATHLRDHDEWGVQWAVLTDPEGNEFCIAQG